ncbi:MAG TPA: hypothetical protein ENK28_14415 [Aliiroseovarius sp.]|nr:hypothetical protein [Aliiroseovarius sp.]
MRPVLHGDISASACVLYLVPPAERGRVLRDMLAEADLADQFRRRTGKGHPLWGDGSLMSVALARPYAREPVLDNPDYAACMAMIFEALVDRA